VREPRLERSVMEVLWGADTALTPAEVRERLRPDHSVAYTTVMTVLTRLWRKKMATRRREGRAFAYRPAEDREAFTARRMEEILGSSGDRSLALSHFLEALSDDERDHLREILE
jgi:predicted transcriptional regulator